MPSNDNIKTNLKHKEKGNSNLSKASEILDLHLNAFN